MISAVESPKLAVKAHVPGQFPPPTRPSLITRVWKTQLASMCVSNATRPTPQPAISAATRLLVSETIHLTWCC